MLLSGNNNRRNNLVMNKYIKLFALAGATFLLGACQEELGLESGAITPGNEILFGANAYFENGEPQTRTQYGDIEGNQIEVLWVPGEDCMDIACPQAVGAAGHQAEYMVSAEDATTAGSGDKTAADDKASVLVRKSPVGLQWSASRTHNFYAAYPSKNQIAARAVGKLAQEDIEQLGMTVSYDQETNAETATLRGFIPVDQSPAAGNIKGDAANGYEVKPDMTYAYMVANASHTRGAGGTVSLLFKPQVTALEFEIVSSALTGNNPQAKYPQFTILGVQLFSKNGQQMAGQFDYTYPLAGSGTGTFTKVAANGYEKITQTFGDGLLVNEGKAVKVTFFMLPGETFNHNSSGDLGLTVIYRVGNNPQVKTATLMKEITPKKKYFFSNVKLPAIDESVSGSSWFSALAPNTLLSQVSIPVAGNVFANTTYGANSAVSQQTLDYETLWKRGVRGFEFVNQSNGSRKGDAVTLADQKFVCTESLIPNSPTFDVAFTTLASYLKQNSGECLVLLMSYQPSNDGYNPDRYVKQLTNYLDSFVTKNTYGYTKSDFVQIKSGTTAENLQGKIAIIIRPGDDDRCEPDKTGITSTANISLGDWSDNLVLIQNWGAAFDAWDKRYDGFARESTYVTNSAYQGNKNEHKNLPQLENYLWGIGSTSSGTFTPITNYASQNNEFNNVNGGDTWKGSFADKVLPKKLNEFKYQHSTTGLGGYAYVQEWMRVAPIDNELNSTGRYAYASDGTLLAGTGYLWVKWPESITEKKNAVKGLFEKSVKNRGIASNDLYINVLSGYYIDWQNDENVKKGLWPFKEEFTGRLGSISWATIKPTGQGKGGNHTKYSYDINKYAYNLLSAVPGTTDALSQNGPWGLVVIDHIGTTQVKELGSSTTKTVSDDKSMNLVDLIMLNNFKFPLATKTQTISTDEVIPGQGDDPQGGTTD